jgi:hypothetical protein
MVLALAELLVALGLAPVIVGRHSRGLGPEELLEPEGPRHPLHGLGTALDTPRARVEGGGLFLPCDVWPLDAGIVPRLLEARAVAADQPLLGWWPTRAGALGVAATCATAAARGARVRDVVRDLGLGTLDVGPVANRNRP